MSLYWNNLRRFWLSLPVKGIRGSVCFIFVSYVVQVIYINIQKKEEEVWKVQYGRETWLDY